MDIPTDMQPYADLFHKNGQMEQTMDDLEKMFESDRSPEMAVFLGELGAFNKLAKKFDRPIPDESQASASFYYLCQAIRVLTNNMAMLDNSDVVHILHTMRADAATIIDYLERGNR